MGAIVFNTLTGAVSEYGGFAVDSITPTHAGSAGGLLAFGGDTDGGAPVIAVATTGRKHWGDIKKKMPNLAHFALVGEGDFEFAVMRGTGESYAYAVPARPGGVTRCKLGLGLRSNYFQFSFTNPDGDAFTLDRIEIMADASAARRV